jgi:hypothetical protein
MEIRYELGIFLVLSERQYRRVEALNISKRDQRQHERLTYRGPVRISWEDDQGLIRYAQAKCLDVSEDGLRIEVAEHIPVRSRLLLHVSCINLSGSATVRSVAWRGCKYILGLNLSQAQPITSASIYGA